MGLWISKCYWISYCFSLIQIFHKNGIILSKGNYLKIKEKSIFTRIISFKNKNKLLLAAKYFKNKPNIINYQIVSVIEYLGSI